MKTLNLKTLCLAVLLAIPSTSALAEKLDGNEVAKLLSSGTLEFQAGSVWRTLPGNTYVFDHRSSSEEGSFKIFQNGNVHIFDEKTGDTIKFRFDRDSDGVISLTYLNGGGKGRTYPLK